MLERILDLFTYTQLVPASKFVEVCLIILAAGIIIRSIVKSDFVKSWTFTALGIIGLGYICIIGTLADVIIFFPAWFITVLIAALIEVRFAEYIQN